MITISVRGDFTRFRATLDTLRRQQLPFAASLALTQTARQAAEDMTRSLPTIFDAKGRRPTPFTMRAIGVAPARKNNLRAEIFVKRRQAQYLGLEETGGFRARAPGAPVLTPPRRGAGWFDANQYGNLRPDVLRKLAAQYPAEYFFGEIHGGYGLWQRVAGRGQLHVLRSPRGLRLLVAFRREGASYRPRFGFHDRVRRSVEAHFLPNLSAGLAKALATAIRH